MKKKQLLLGAMGLMMAGVLAMPVNAKERTTNVSYTETNAYEISIPENLELKPGEEKTLTISMSKMNVSPTEQVTVKVKSGIKDGAVTLTRENASDVTTSTVSLQSGGTGIADNAVVATFKDQNTAPEQGGGTLYFTGLAGNLKAGNWKGTMVFEAEIVAR